MVGELLELLQSHGIKLSVKDGRLISVAQPGTLTPELRKKIGDHKPEILALLNTQDSSAPVSVEIERLENQRTAPLSMAQRRIAMTTPPGAALSTAFLLEGSLDTGNLEKVLNFFVERHAVLRSKFLLSGTDPFFTVNAYTPFGLQVTTLKNNSDEVLNHELEKRQRLELDPANARCFLFELLHASPERNILFASFSPLVFDGWSFDLFWNELTSIYAELESGNTPQVAPPDYSYADCASWLERRLKENHERLTRFWNQHLGPTLPLDVFPLTATHHTQKNTTSLPLQLSRPLIEKLRSFSEAHALTPQVVLLAAVYVWGQKLRGSRVSTEIDNGALDIVLGIAVEGRPHRALEDVVGPFANLILLRQQVPPDAQFDHFARQVRDDFLSAHQHQEFPLESHQVSSPHGSTKTFQIEFSFQQATGRNKRMGTLNISQLELSSGTCSIDLTFWVKDWGDKISGAVEFLSDAFETVAVEQWIRSYYYLLDQLLDASRPTLSRAGILSPSDKENMQKRVDKGEIEWVTDRCGNPLPYGTPGTLSNSPGTFVCSSTSGIEPIEFVAHPQPQEDVINMPASDTETRLESILGKLLGHRIDVCANFVDLGLNSLTALRFIARCRDEIGVHLAVSSLFEHASIRSLASLIDSDGVQLEAMTIVPLQPEGANPPLYCICGINLYQPLAVALGKEQPSYGIYIPDEHKLLMNTTEYTPRELARVYWGAIEKYHGDGPLSILGFCFGGAIAYEIARLARQSGIEVRQLVLVDTLLAKNMKRRFPNRLSQLVPERWKEPIKTMINRTSSPAPLADSHDEGETMLKETAMVMSKRLDDFVPDSKYSGAVIQIDSGDPDTRANWIKSARHGWEKILVGEVVAVNLDASHMTVLSESCSQEIATKIRSLLATRDSV